MPQQERLLTVEAPGFNGLNTQQAGSILPAGWATKLENFAFGESGRITARRGSQDLNATAATGSPTIDAAFEYADNAGNKLLVFAGGNKLWKVVAGVVTDITGTATTPTGDHWQFANFNGKCVGYQTGHEPIVLLTTSSSFIDAADEGGAASKTMFDGNVVVSAYGRTWTVHSNTLYYSDLLIHSYAGGSSGSFDLAQFWPAGVDVAVAIADFNGFLVIFGRDSIIVWQNPDDVSNMFISDKVATVGCIARDTVQEVGNDLVFLSDSGLKGLGRVLGTENLPIQDISRYVRSALTATALAETAAEIRSVYNSEEGFYLVSFPTAGISYYFDLKYPNKDGSWKACRWDFAPTALTYSPDDQRMYMSRRDGFMQEYLNYYDNRLAGGTGGTAYSLDWESVWNDLGQDVASLIKIPKNVSMLAAGTPGSAVAFKWAYDYGDTFNNVTMNFSGSPPPSYGGGFTWGGNYTYGAAGNFQRVRSPVGSAGQVIKIGMTTTVAGYSFSLQRVDLLVKLGRVGI